MANRIQVGPNRWIGETEEPYVIAEIGINHNGSFELCKKMIAAVVANVNFRITA